MLWIRKKSGWRFWKNFIPAWNKILSLISHCLFVRYLSTSVFNVRSMNYESDEGSEKILRGFKSDIRNCHILIEIYNNWKIQDSRFSLFEIQIRKESRKILQGFESDIEFEKNVSFRCVSSDTDSFSAEIQGRVFDWRFSENRRDKGKLLLVRFIRRGVKKRGWMAPGALHPPSEIKTLIRPDNIQLTGLTWILISSLYSCLSRSNAGPELSLSPSLSSDIRSPEKFDAAIPILGAL